MALSAGDDEESDLDAEASAASARSAQRAAQERRAEEDRARVAAGARQERSSRAAYEEALRSLQGRRAQLEQKLLELAVMQRDLERKIMAEQGRAGSPSPAGEAEREQAEAEMRAARAAVDGEREATAELGRMREAERMNAPVERQGAQRKRTAEEERAEREFIESTRGGMAERAVRPMGQQARDLRPLRIRSLGLKSRSFSSKGRRGRALLAVRLAWRWTRDPACASSALAPRRRTRKDSDQAMRELRDRLRELEGARGSSTCVEERSGTRLGLADR
jgi:hypothetical protein